MTVPAPAPKRSPLRWILVIVAVVLVVCCGGAGVSVFAIYKLASSAAAPARDATDRYFAALEAGHPADAYAQTCPDFRSRITERDFLDAEATPPRGHRIVGTSVSTVNGQRSALITVDVTRGAVNRITVPLVAVGATWYVCPEYPLP